MLLSELFGLELSSHRRLACNGALWRLVVWVLSFGSWHTVVDGANFSSQVNWRISLAASDAKGDCDSVCTAAGLSCIEICWPSSLAGMENVANDATFPGRCHLVSSGSTAPWQPAKDPVSTVCFWEPGVVVAPRCPVKPGTPASDAAAGKLVRRICPCIAALFRDSRSIDCGLGGELPLAVNYRTSAPVSSSPQPSAATPVALSTTSQTPLRVTTKAPFTSPCQSLCVSGFGMDDAELNGQFQLSGNWQWSRFAQSTESRLQLSGGQWSILEVKPGGANFTLAKGTSGDASSTTLPVNIYLLTSTSGWSVNLRCCEIAASSASMASSASTEGKSADMVSISSGILAIIVVGVVFVGLCLVVVGLLYWRKGRNRSVPPDDHTSEFTVADGLDPEVHSGLRKAAMACGKDKNASKYSQGTLPSLARATSCSGDDYTRSMRGTWRGSDAYGAKLASNTAATALNVFDYNFGIKDKGAIEVASVLGRGDLSSANTYEGPVRPWWGTGEQDANDRQAVPDASAVRDEDYSRWGGVPQEPYMRKLAGLYSNDNCSLGIDSAPTASRASPLRATARGGGVALGGHTGSPVGSSRVARQERRISNGTTDLHSSAAQKFVFEKTLPSPTAQLSSQTRGTDKAWSPVDAMSMTSSQPLSQPAPPPLPVAMGQLSRPAVGAPAFTGPSGGAVAASQISLNANPYVARAAAPATPPGRLRDDLADAQRGLKMQLDMLRSRQAQPQ